MDKKSITLLLIDELVPLLKPTEATFVAQFFSKLSNTEKAGTTLRFLFHFELILIVKKTENVFRNCKRTLVTLKLTFRKKLEK